MNEDLFKSSDHAPIMKIVRFGETEIRVASWNILFEKWLRMNVDAKDPATGQIDMRGGHIGKYFPQLVETKSDERTLTSLFTIASLIKSQKIDIFALQEFNPEDSNDLLRTLQFIRPARMIIVDLNELPGFDADAEADRTAKGNNDLQVMIYNEDKLKFIRALSRVIYYSPGKPNKRIVSLIFEDVHNKTVFRFVNTHVEFGKMFALTEYVDQLEASGERAPFIVAGDMNQEEVPPKLSNDGSTYVFTTNGFPSLSETTHIDTNGKAVVFDHIWTKNIN